MFHGKNNIFNSEYVAPEIKPRRKQKLKPQEVEIIDQKSGKTLVEIPAGAALGFAQEHPDQDLLFIGYKDGYMIDSWTISEVLMGYLEV